MLVSVGASYDGATRRAAPTCRPATSRCSTRCDGWTVHVPGHAGEVAPLLRAAADHDDPVYLRLSAQANDAAPRRTRIG